MLLFQNTRKTSDLDLLPDSQNPIAYFSPNISIRMSGILA